MQPKDDKKIITLVVDSRLESKTRKCNRQTYAQEKKNRNGKIYIGKFSKTPHFKKAPFYTP